jgi:hypothetical protein
MSQQLDIKPLKVTAVPDASGRAWRPGTAGTLSETRIPVPVPVSARTLRNGWMRKGGGEEERRQGGREREGRCLQRCVTFQSALN